MESLAPATQAAASHDLSIIALFMSADWVVKAVMIGLALASVWCWAVIFNRVTTYMRARRENKAFEKAFGSGLSLEQLHERFASDTRGMAAILGAGMEEWHKSRDSNAATRDGLRSRLEIALDLAVTEQSEALERRLGLLATVGSAAPFVGLFGTVWGIMNAFTAIAAAEDTSLAVVAPGIAEALFATALGLLAAIPAVIAYNKLSAEAGRLNSKLEAFADRLTVILSRHLDAGSGT